MSKRRKEVEPDSRQAIDASEVIDFLESGGRLPEELRARLHALTRQVKLSDEDLQTLLNRYIVGADSYRTSLDFLKDLRDRYEERGKYAPSADSMPADIHIPNPK